MFNRFSVSSIIILAASIWAASLWLFGINLSWEYAKPFSTTVGVVTAVLIAFDKFLWRWAPIRWFHSLPDIRGQWVAELRSSYVDPQMNKPSDPILGTAIIRQTFSSISIRLETKSSTSFLLAERLIRHGDGASEVIAVYQSDPSIHLRGGESEIHYGAFRYSISGSPPAEMNGHYWTDRRTSGSIRLIKRQ